MSRNTRILFVYPNERQMSTIPPAIALLSQLLKQNGHVTDIFDTTFYEFGDDIAIEEQTRAKYHLCRHDKRFQIAGSIQFFPKTGTQQYFD